MKNVVNYSLLDTAMNGWLIENGILDIHKGGEIGLAGGLSRPMLTRFARLQYLGRKALSAVRRRRAPANRPGAAARRLPGLPFQYRPACRCRKRIYAA